MPPDRPELASTRSEGRIAGDGEPATRPAGARVGRFVVLDPLGQGGMAMVFAAFDPDLDRKVAIKILVHGDSEGRRRERMMREARALARLSHPNVLAIHEVGTIGDDVFIATELAHGGTLRAWSATPRTWREVRDVFVQAGRGLEAAHEAGLVHRDVKPENVLLTADGRVCVADFGLVGYDAHDVDTDDGDGDGEPVDVASAPLTRTGAIIGTPAYMAPEQHRGAAVGPAADQFAFCVALWEALYGRRPFTGSGADLADAVLAGRVDDPPADRDVPAWLRDVVRRGLRAEPADRWPSMTALLAALGDDRDAARRRRGRVAAIGITVAAASVAGFVVAQRGGADDGPRCAGMARHLDGVWDPARAAAAREAFIATGRPRAADTFALVAARLDEHAARWTELRVAACEAHAAGERSGELLDLGMACLDRRKAELDALVHVFTDEATANVVGRAPAATGQLPPLASCDDAGALRAAVPPPADPATRAVVDSIRRSLDRAKALGDAGQVRPALALAVEAVTRARPLGHAPLLADALHRRGVLEGAVGDVEAADATLEQAVLEAASARDDELAARSWDERLYVIGVLRGRPDDALALRTAAEAAVRRAGGGRWLDARLAHNLGNVLTAAARPADALPYFERAVADKEAVFGADGGAVAPSLNGLAVAHMELGHHNVAAQLFHRAQGIWERTLGPAHPYVAGVLDNLGNLMMHQGRNDLARDHHQRALAIREEVYGPAHPLVADSRDNLGLALAELGDLDEALRQHEHALALRVRALGPDHSDVGYSQTNLGGIYQRLGRLEEAEAALRRALVIWEAEVGADDPSLAETVAALADVLRARGRTVEARAVAERARTLAARDGP